MDKITSHPDRRPDKHAEHAESTEPADRRPQDPAARRDSPADHAFPGQFARTRRFTLGVPRDFTLAPDGRSALFLRTRGPEDPVSCLWLRDAGGEHLLADPAGLGSGGDHDLPEAERIRRERARERASGIVGYATDAAVRRVVFTIDAALWTFDLPAGPGGVRPRHVPTPGPVVDPRPDPAGRRVAYVSGGALRVVDLDSGADRALAEPEGPEVAYGLAEHVAAESMHRRRGHWWAPDGERLLAARVDTTPVQRWWIGDPSDPARRPREVPYPVAGTANADVSLHVLGVDGSRTEVGWDRAAFEYLTAVDWDAHGPLIGVQSRDQRTLRVLGCDPGTGATHVLHEQRDPAWVALIPGTPARTASGALVHVADLGATRRLTVDGRPVTPEGLQVGAVVGVDGESVLFLGVEEPTESHLWSYGPDPAGSAGGTGRVVRLSEGPGLHTGQRAGAGLLLDSQTEDGREVTLSAGALLLPVACLAAEPVVRPRPVWLRAGEHDIRTALLLPSWYEPGAGPLPVLLAPYSGPAMRVALRARTGPLCQAQWFAEEGFAVIVADGRGTPGRGPVWEKSVHGDTLSAPVEDQVSALMAAARHCPDLDLGRVAIRGWSFGGSLAAMAVLRRPDVFHAAVCGAGPSDQRLYDTHWRERFLGHPDEEPAAYERSSPISEAASLARPLLLVHGLADDNVVAAHTLRMSAALLAAGRPHQVLPLPSATHSPADPVVVEGLMRHEVDFLRNALNAAPLPTV